MNCLTDPELFRKLLQDDEKAFAELFHRYYAALCAYAFSYLKDEEQTGELVQELFVQLWEKRAQIAIHSSVKSYLFRMIKNQLINRMNHQKVEQRYLKKLEQDERELSVEQLLPEVDLLQKIEAGIEALPPKRREIFKLSREQGLTYREIAERLNLSVKTVETQMGLALKQLREELKDFRHLLIGFNLFEKISEAIQGK